MKKYGSYRTDKILKFEISDRVKFMQKTYGWVFILPCFCQNLIVKNSTFSLASTDILDFAL